MTLRCEGLAVAGRLKGASLALAAGAITAIVGPNGAGKSTLLAALAGLLQPDGGRVSLDGAPLAALPPRERAKAIGYLPQTHEVAWDIDVATLAGLGRLPWRSAPGEDRRAVDAALAAVDLQEMANRPVSRLSGGELARALLARVLAGEPRVVLADEPLAALDLAHQQAMLRHFRALADAGVAVALVLHDLAAARNSADHVAVLDRGRIGAAGPPAEVLTPAQMAETWGITAEWLGRDGHWALATTL